MDTPLKFGNDLEFDTTLYNGCEYYAGIEFSPWW